jgi:uncharacterized phage-like protein YoqJ
MDPEEEAAEVEEEKMRVEQYNQYMIEQHQQHQQQQQPQQQIQQQQLPQHPVRVTQYNNFIAEHTDAPSECGDCMED